MTAQAPPKHEQHDQPQPGIDRGPVSPDQLDRLLTLIRPSVWIVLAALLVLVGLVVAWGFLGTVQQTVEADGIIQRGSGLREAQAPVAGEVSAVRASQGKKVRRGDVLFTIERDDGEPVQVRAPIDASVLDVSVRTRAVVAPGQRLATMEPSRGALAATLAVPAAHRSEVFAGEPVQVTLDSLDDELGYVNGEIESIDSYPADERLLDEVFGGERVIADVAGSSAVYLAHVRLRTDPATASGLDWSSRAGAEVTVNAGQLARGRIVVSESSLFGEVFP